MEEPKGEGLPSPLPFRTDTMAPLELYDTVHKQPFEPFRLVMTDGVGYDIRHPDLLMVGLQTATVGLSGEKAQQFYERTVKVDLLHVIRLEPLETASKSSSNEAS